MRAADLVFLEVDVPQVEDGGQDAEDAVLVLRAEVQNLQGIEQTVEILQVHLARDLTVPSLQRGGE